MLPDDELDELTADIRANGLLMPLLVGRVDGQTVLIDGRNRREACKRAGMVPHHVLLDGQDPVTFILSANINRRHMTKSQRAVTVAKICSFSGQTQRQLAGQTSLSKGLIGNAAIVLQHAPDLAASVLAGHISLDNAYEEARIRKGQADTYEARFQSLKAAAPDLADLVVDGQLQLAEAQAAYDQRVCAVVHSTTRAASG
jgi:ParB/RepB/Spo0J family partition protein